LTRHWPQIVVLSALPDNEKYRKRAHYSMKLDSAIFFGPWRAFAEALRFEQEPNTCNRTALIFNLGGWRYRQMLVALQFEVFCVPDNYLARRPR
jgi:hypothetical protein